MLIDGLITQEFPSISRDYLINETKFNYMTLPLNIQG